MQKSISDFAPVDHFIKELSHLGTLVSTRAVDLRMVNRHIFSSRTVLANDKSGGQHEVGYGVQNDHVI